MELPKLTRPLIGRSPAFQQTGPSFQKSYTTLQSPPPPLNPSNDAHSLHLLDRKGFILQDLAPEENRVMAAKPQSVNGSESEFEFIETPKAATPTFEKFEDCGVKTTSVRAAITSHGPRLSLVNSIYSFLPSRTLLFPLMVQVGMHFQTFSSSPSSSLCLSI